MTDVYDKPPVEGGNAYLLICQVVQDAGPAHVYPRSMYRGCWYERHGEPSCLVGRALALHGVSLADLEAFDCDSIWLLHKAGRVPYLTDHAVRVFAAAQGAQDNCAPWGRAKDAARDELVRLGLDVPAWPASE